MPMPSCPLVLLPQHHTAPAVVMAQAVPALNPLGPPAATRITPANQVTGTGRVLFTVVPLPSWPEKLRPQHHTPPVGPPAAHENQLPTPMDPFPVRKPVPVVSR